MPMRILTNHNVMRLKIYQTQKFKRLSRRQLALLVSVLVPFMPGYLAAKPYTLTSVEQGSKKY